MPDVDELDLDIEYVKDLYDKSLKENRMILDNLEALDNWSESSVLKTSKMVYRDAPRSWVDAKDSNGIIKEYGFCSTSTEPGASMEGMIGKNAQKNIRYTIILPENTKYGNLTYTSEKEMVLPRFSRFLQISSDTLVLLLDGMPEDKNCYIDLCRQLEQNSDYDCEESRYSQSSCEYEYDEDNEESDLQYLYI